MEQFYTMQELYDMFSKFHSILVYYHTECDALLSAQFSPKGIHMNTCGGRSTILLQGGGNMFYLKEPDCAAGSDYKFRCLVENRDSERKLKLFTPACFFTIYLR